MPRSRIPTKAELIQLQRLYKTDDKIAERLGSVTPQLVAYWRRKKNIARHSFPKFSAAEIRDVWERFGDDYRCGLELGISKAAFYNWRRKYGLKDKPAFLKLEQLELNLAGSNRAQGRRPAVGRQTITQKALALKSHRDRVEIGEMVEVEPDLAVLHDHAGKVINLFRESGSSFVWNPNRILISLSELPGGEEEHLAQMQKEIREFAARQNLKYFYDLRDGVCHQVVIEKGHILPGELAVGTNTHTTSYGCIGALATEIPIEKMVSLWTTGTISLPVPASIRIAVNGKAARGVFARDILLFIRRHLGNGKAKGKAVEYYGPAISQMSISERFTLCHLSSELDAVASMVPYDSVTRRFYIGRTRMPYRPLLADKDADYEESFELNIGQIGPQVARPGGNPDINEIGEVEGMSVNQVILGSCANGRFEDLRIAADIIKGKRIHAGVRMIVYPGSRAVLLEALKKGLIRAFVEAGAIVMNPGCGPCGNSHRGLVAPGERCLSTASGPSTDFPRPNSGEIFLVSPATAAASALKGAITDPRIYLK